MEKEFKTLAEALPEEIKRVQEIIAEYKSLPGISGIAWQLMQPDVNEALDAMMHQDVVRMLAAYTKLKEWEM